MISISRHKKIIRSLTIILLFTFCFSFIGLPYNYAFAREIAAAPKMVDKVPPISDTVNQPETYGDVVIAPPSDFPDKPGKERMEIPSRRSVNSKVYLEPDGTLTQEIYPNSIFFKNDKLEWVPIENNIVAAEAPFKVKNKANHFGVFFEDRAKVRFEKKEALIDIQPVDAAPSQGVVNENKIKYSNIYNNVDIEYTSESDMVKEDIILNSPDAPNTFTFDVKARNLKIEKDAETGLLTLFDKKDKPVAYFMAPFMVDAKGEVSDKVSLEFKNDSGKEQLVLTADSTWLKDPDRQYPVKVDPTLITDNIRRDAFVSERYPTSSFYSVDFLSSGYDSTYYKTRSFIEFVLPNLPSSSYITSSNVQFYQSLSNASTTVDLNKITSSWYSSTTTWNNQPGYFSTPETSLYLSGTLGYWSFGITDLAKSWYAASTPNHGIAVKHSNESVGSKRFTSNNGTANWPKLVVSYKVDPIGQESQWGFTQDGINGFNGNLIEQVTDLNIPGRGIPVSFTRTYNSRSAKDSVFGYGWVANVGMSIKDSGYGPVIFTDEDGTEHIFSRQTDDTFVAPTGVFLELVKDHANNTYTITKKDGVKIEFNTSGQVTEISDPNKTPNATTFNYTSGKLSSISDASGRVTNFYYNASGKLSKITDPASRDVLYDYDANGNLTTVTDPAGKVTTYGYDADHNLTSITDPNGKTVSIGYDTVNDRVTSVSKTITVNGTPTVSTTTLTYDTVTYTTTRTDARNNITKYIYDAEGKIKEIVQDPSGLNYSTKFSYDVDNNVNQITDPKNGTYTASYQLGKGNLINETNPLNEKYQYSYDSRNNQTQQIDPENRVENYSYDKSNNNTDITDAFTQTSADRYLSNGNVEYETTPMSAAENLVTNSSAERDANFDNWPDEWNKYQGGTASFVWSTVSKIGDRSLEIGDTTSWADIMNSRAILYDSTKTYALSGYIQTETFQPKPLLLKSTSMTAPATGSGIPPALLLAETPIGPGSS